MKFTKRLPRGPFGCVAMDPPWEYLGYSGGTVPHRRKEGAPYEPMALADIKALPVPDVCAKDAVIAMWILGSHIDQGIDLARHWGFRFVTDVFFWDKACRWNDDLQAWVATKSIGFGKWSRKQGEQCFLFKRGEPHPKPGSRGVRQIIRAKPREHSRKPDEFFPAVEALFHGPYLEMFSRESRPGWKSWGPETGKFDAAK